MSKKVLSHSGLMNRSFLKRIKTELENVSRPENRIDGVEIVPRKDNERFLDIYIKGPSDTPYEGGRFHLQYFLPEKYPFSPPLVYFVTKIWHPNIDYLGRICLDTIGEKWTPALQIQSVCLSILLLLQTPNPDDPLDSTIAEQWKRDPEGAELKAKDWTRRFARA